MEEPRTFTIISYIQLKLKSTGMKKLFYMLLLGSLLACSTESPKGELSKAELPSDEKAEVVLSCKAIEGSNAHVQAWGCKAAACQIIAAGCAEMIFPAGHEEQPVGFDKGTDRKHKLPAPFEFIALVRQEASHTKDLRCMQLLTIALIPKP